jgi:hypothetical protein
MSGRKHKQRRKEERDAIREWEDATGDVAVYAEVFPGDPSYVELDPIVKERVVREGIARGDFHPDCPLCMLMLEHESMLIRLGPDDA